MSFDSGGPEHLRPSKGIEEGLEVLRGASVPMTNEDSAQERRRSPRYKCTGSAEFRTSGTDVRTWGTLTDISLEGCYVEMMATYPVGRTVDLVLEVNGIRAGLRGEVRVSYPCLGMGIAFREMSDDDRAKLKKMVNSVSPEQVQPQEEHPLETAPLVMPLIVNAGAALQGLAAFFETHAVLSKEDFVRILRKTQRADEFRDNLP